MATETKVLITVLFLFWGSCSYSQQLSHQVMVPAAGLAASGVVNYSQTIGETAIEIFSCSGFEFTQGFQQPGMKYSPEDNPEGNGVEVYPNPVADNLNVKFFGDVARKFRVDIINIAGTVVESSAITFITVYYHIEQINVQKLKKGFYFVRVVSGDGLISRTFKIEKM